MVGKLDLYILFKFGCEFIIPRHYPGLLVISNCKVE